MQPCLLKLNVYFLIFSPVFFEVTSQCIGNLLSIAWTMGRGKKRVYIHLQSFGSFLVDTVNRSSLHLYL